MKNREREKNTKGMGVERLISKNSKIVLYYMFISVPIGQLHPLKKPQKTLPQWPCQLQTPLGRISGIFPPRARNPSALQVKRRFG